MSQLTSMTSFRLRESGLCQMCVLAFHNQHGREMRLLKVSVHPLLLSRAYSQVVGSVDNILLSLPYVEERYRKTLETCALFKILEDGDYSEIGERGVNLSGGQKARGSFPIYFDHLLIFIYFSFVGACCLLQSFDLIPG
jgi:hypothetical protein